jgi:hypothetical protein
MIGSSPDEQHFTVRVDLRKRAAKILVSGAPGSGSTRVTIATGSPYGNTCPRPDVINRSPFFTS